ncbi:MAG: hypothetical protein AAGI38_20590 [Bacteroidota bacterium]
MKQFVTLAVFFCIFGHTLGQDILAQKEHDTPSRAFESIQLDEAAKTFALVMRVKSKKKLTEYQENTYSLEDMSLMDSKTFELTKEQVKGKKN